MKYLYTTEPDESCHKIHGVYGRPVHTSEQKSLKAKGWKENPDELREEAEEVGEDDREVWADLYEDKLGKRPHHKAKVETIRQKVEESDD